MVGTGRAFVFMILLVSHELSGERLSGHSELLNFVSYDMEVKKKKNKLWISPRDLFELLTAVMKVIPEVFSTSLVTDDFVWMLY